MHAHVVSAMSKYLSAEMRGGRVVRFAFDWGPRRMFGLRAVNERLRRGKVAFDVEKCK